MNTLDIARDLSLTAKRVASTKGGEYASACPVCGGRDRFRVWPHKGDHGSWLCRGCDKGGDAIELLKFARGLSYKEACEYLGKEARAYKRGRTPRAPKTEPPDFVPQKISDPADLWQAKAAAFAEYAHKQLLKNTEQLAWLAARGITLETVRRFKLGWNDKKIWRKRSAWGVPDKTVKDDSGAEKVLTLFALHRGLVIPYIPNFPPYQGGTEGGLRIHRLRIRRPEEGLDDRYHVIPGSSMAPMVIARSEATRQSPGAPAATKHSAWAVVESELDAILIAQDAGDLVGSAGLGSVTTKPDETLGRELDQSPCILCALDADEAGKKRWPWWQKLYPQADRWPVPSGKDPGDYKKAGFDVRAWILAGLPLGLRPAPPVQEVSLDHFAAGGKMIESEALPLKQDGQFDKKAGLPVSDDEASLTPFYAATAACRCGRPLDYYGPVGSPAYKGPCFKCLPSPADQQTRRKKKWQTQE